MIFFSVWLDYFLIDSVLFYFNKLFSFWLDYFLIDSIQFYSNRLLFLFRLDTNLFSSVLFNFQMCIIAWLLCLPVAEVQAHSSQQSRAEMDQLREQLIDAFRQQMDIRKRLMELDNSNMEIQIDTSKHLLTIAEWVFILHTNSDHLNITNKFTVALKVYDIEHYQLFYHFRPNELPFVNCFVAKCSCALFYLFIFFSNKCLVCVWYVVIEILSNSI